MDCKKEALPLMHKYLDGELDGSEAKVLYEHLSICAVCRKRLLQLEKAEALIRSWPNSQVPDGLKERVLHALPPMPRKRNSWFLWLRRHPAIAAAAAFLFIMMASLITLWNEDKEMWVKGQDLQSIIIQGDTVIVPEGKIVKGNLTVSQGRLEIYGEVTGNITIIDGTVFTASTAQVADVTQIDEAFSWLWFKMNSLFAP